MKSLVQAINNLANSINKLADSRKLFTSQPVSNPYDSISKLADTKKPIVPQTTTSNPYAGSVNITSASYVSKDTEGWHTLNAAEKEQLYYIYKAITVKEKNHNYYIYTIYTGDISFNKVMDDLKAYWPSLYTPIKKLILLKKISTQDKYNKTSSKEVWNFPHDHGLA